MKYIVLIFTVLTMFFNSFAQVNEEEQKVQETIESFFSIFPERDGAKLASYFAENVSMATVYKNQKDSTILEYGDVEKFIKAFGTKDGNKWEEEVSNFKIQIDGSFAQVWCDYQFIYNEKISHCGVDAFHLAKINDTWKIVHLADTRRKCQ